MDARIQLTNHFDRSADAVIFTGSCLDLLKSIPSNSIQLIVPPPYNLGKEYEQKQQLDEYANFQAAVIKECVRVLKDTGSICWQVGNYVGKKANGFIVPLDILLYPIFAAHALERVVRAQRAPMFAREGEVAEGPSRVA